MLNSVSSQNINFTDRTFSNIVRMDDFEGEAVEYITKKGKKTVLEIKSEYFRANAKFEEKIRLVKKLFSYGHEHNSKPLPAYKGTLDKNKGYSTETGGYGGGWLLSNINTPLSTTDVHTCGALNLVNDLDEEHLFYHVLDETTPKQIKTFIKENFPRFNKVNIVPGDRFETNNTVNNILSAINEINPMAEKNFYHFSSENPEIVAHKGILSYVEGQKPKEVTFRQVDQYFDPNDYI